MVQKVCLDSDILIDLLRGKEETRKRLEDLESRFCTTAITEFELWLGRRDGEVVENVLDSLQLLPFDRASARIAGDMHKKLKKKGAVVDLRDLFIASSCIAQATPLLTNNKKHFTRLKSFGLELV